MSETIDYLRKLKQPFEVNEIEWRINRHGFSGVKPWATAIPYITSRAVQDRLDEVFGIAGWSNEIKMVNNKGFLSCIKIKLDGEWVAKWDGAEGSESNTMDLIKSGSSNALKRAAVLIGIGRYLYDLDESFVTCEVAENYRHAYGNVYKDKKNEGKLVAWKTPTLPNMALPGFDINQYIDDMREAKSTKELMSSYELAKKAAKLHNDKTMLDSAKAVGAEMKEEFKQRAALMVAEDTAAINKWLDKQILSFSMLLTIAAIDTVYSALSSELKNKLKDTMVDPVGLNLKLTDTYKARATELTGDKK